jgi:hypothetical protein
MKDVMRISIGIVTLVVAGLFSSMADQVYVQLPPSSLGSKGFVSVDASSPATTNQVPAGTNSQPLIQASAVYNPGTSRKGTEQAAASNTVAVTPLNATAARKTLSVQKPAGTPGRTTPDAALAISNVAAAKLLQTNGDRQDALKLGSIGAAPATDSKPPARPIAGITAATMAAAGTYSNSNVSAATNQAALAQKTIGATQVESQSVSKSTTTNTVTPGVTNTDNHAMGPASPAVASSQGNSKNTGKSAKKAPVTLNSPATLRAPSIPIIGTAPASTNQARLRAQKIAKNTTGGKQPAERAVKEDATPTPKMQPAELESELSHLDPTGEFVERFVRVPAGQAEEARVIRFLVPVLRVKESAGH